MHLAEIEQEVAGSLGRGPSTPEMLALLEWGVRALPERAVTGVEPDKVMDYVLATAAG